MTMFWTITTPLILLLDGYLIGTYLERHRQVRRQQQRDAELLAILDDLRLLRRSQARPTDGPVA